MKSRTKKILPALVAASMVAAACGSDSNDSVATDAPPATEAEEVAEGPGTIVDVAVEAGSFTTLVAAVEAAGLVETLSGEGPFTVFAPTDEAFAALLSDLGITAEELLADTDLLTSVLTYHVVPGAVLAETVVTLDGESVETVNGASVEISVDGDIVKVNDANVTATDIEASNGVIHVLDAVLLPPADDAMEEDAMEDDAMEEDAMEEDAMEEDAMADEPGTIVDVAVEAGSFTTLVAAVQAAGLVETLSSEGPFTVFAPTDDAFAALLSDLGLTAQELLADTELLTSVLTYHVVPGEVLAETVVTLDGESVETVNGASVEISVDGDVVMVNDATVTAVDVDASNGVIHVIDSVLLPPADDAMEEDAMEEDAMADEPGTIVDVAVEAGSFTTLVAAVQAAGLVETLSSEGPFTVFAPTDDAFAALLSDLGLTAEELLADTELLTSVLTYHVVPGEVLAETVVTLDGESVETVNGASVEISVDGDVVMVNDATVTAVDVDASNGVIHVIDTVLIPSS
ncbi:hypothetical protein YM304_40300 [Ilumatobacter coccineus YM16-304]|uniref:FAS1 domain-containing protein n=2 Tax=Ilumatobacter coccineus TaxID=467094 RepID=A0A6C7E9L1_ILUCY|nr:hypothetical protein YM304_40300 [Ilumatobacter coccineus YM16-304]